LHPQELSGKGYNEDSLSKLLRSDSSRGELLNRVGTLQKFEEETSKMGKQLKALHVDMNNALKA